MPEIDVTIGGRAYRIACDPGEELPLRTAADALEGEIEKLTRAVGRLPESRMLLMAGLMLADRLQGMETKLAEAERDKARAAAEPAPVRKVQPPVAVVPQPNLFADQVAEAALALLDRTALRLEDLAGRVEAAPPA
jgi:cell division protein ZapA